MPMTDESSPESAASERKKADMNTFGEWLHDIHFPEYRFKVGMSRTGAMYLQAHYFDADTVNGQRELQETRRWWLSPYMTKSEFVQTALKLVLTSVEHRAREFFLYRGKAVFQPHHNVDTLWETCDERVMR